MTLKDFKLTSNNNFVAYQPYNFFFKRIYLVLITKNYLVGLVCNNNLGVEKRDDDIVLGNKTLNESTKKVASSNPFAYLKAKLIKKIENKYFFDQSIYAVDKANFRIDRNDVDNATHSSAKVDTGNYPNAGSISIEIKRGLKHDFILLGHQDGKEVLNSILTRDRNTFLN